MNFNNTRQNHESGEAFEPDSPELALTKNVLANFLEDSFYESAEDSLTDIEEAFFDCAEENPEFVLKLAKYARQEENLRQVPQALLVFSANYPTTQEFVRDYATDIMARTDEPLEVLAFHVSRNGKTIPNCLQKSIEDAMHQWNEWQYAKWDRSSREWQYRDLMNLVHPRPRDDEREAIFEKIAHGDLDDYEVEPLKQEDTWESALSDDSDDRSKAEKYRDELEEDEDGYSMGLFPRIRQARDMLESGVTAEEIFGDVSDEWIQNSRLYPFRFYQAYKAVRGEGVIPEGERQAALEFLEHAMEVSTENLPDVLEDTFVAVDTSGSMRSPVSGDSDLECVEIGALFGSLLYRRGADLAAFATDTQTYHGDRRDAITTTMKGVQSLDIGGGTNGYLVPQGLRENNMTSYNQVVVFTDMQMWGGSRFNSGSTFRDEWNQYKEVNPDASLYLVDLQNYGTLQIPEGANGVYQLQGWTSEIVNYIDSMEKVESMVSEIESVQPDD